MKRYFILGLLLSSLVRAAVGNADLQEIQALINEGKYAAALEKHLWFHEESKTSTGMGGVRLSFALSQWHRLGEKYPPALDALEDIRDRHAAQLLKGEANFPEFQEFNAINRTLKEDEKTYTLFTELDQRHPDIAKRCFQVAMELIVKHGNYELCGKYIEDPLGDYEKARHMREMNLNMVKTRPQMDNPGFRNYTDSAFIKKTLQLIEIMTHLKRMAEAREIQQRAMAYFPTPEIERALPKS